MSPFAASRRNHVGEKVSHAQVAGLVAEVRREPALAHLSANKISRAVRAFLETGQDRANLIGWITSRADSSGRTVYADPTGQAAVRNVERGRGQ